MKKKWARLSAPKKTEANLFLITEGGLDTGDFYHVAFVQFFLSCDLLAVNLYLDLGLGCGDEVFVVALVDERGHVGSEETLEFDGGHIGLTDDAHLAGKDVARRIGLAFQDGESASPFPGRSLGSFVRWGFSSTCSSGSGACSSGG